MSGFGRQDRLGTGARLSYQDDDELNDPANVGDDGGLNMELAPQGYDGESLFIRSRAGHFQQLNADNEGQAMLPNRRGTTMRNRRILGGNNGRGGDNGQGLIAAGTSPPTVNHFTFHGPNNFQGLTNIGGHFTGNVQGNINGNRAGARATAPSVAAPAPPVGAAIVGTQAAPEPATVEPPAGHETHENSAPRSG